MKETVELLQEVGFKVRRLGTIYLREELVNDMDVFGDVVSLSKFKIIALAAHESDGIKYRELIKQTGLAKSTMSITISELCDLDLVSKEVRGSSENTYIKVTKLGKKYSKIYRNVIHKLNDKVFGNLSTDEHNVLDKVLLNIDKKL